MYEILTIISRAEYGGIGLNVRLLKKDAASCINKASDRSGAHSRIIPLEKKLRGSYQWRLLAFILVCGFILNPTFVILSSLLIDQHGHISIDSVKEGIGENVEIISPIMQLKYFCCNDSLGTMLPALDSLNRDKEQSPYQVVFFENHIKFQYPLTSLVPFYLLEKFGVVDDWLFQIYRAVCWCAFIGIIIFSNLIAYRLIRRKRPAINIWPDYVVASATIVVAALLFNPITSGIYLGQIQTILALGFTISLYCWMSGREKTSGAILGIMMLLESTEFRPTGLHQVRQSAWSGVSTRY